MGDVTHLDDVAGARKSVAVRSKTQLNKYMELVRNNLWDWQSLQPTSGPGTQFYKFCDALEVKDGQSTPATGWGLVHALSAWSSYFKNTYYTRSMPF